MEEVICRADYKFEAEMNGMQGVLLGISFGVFLSLIFFMFSDLKSLSPHKIKVRGSLQFVFIIKVHRKQSRMILTLLCGCRPLVQDPAILKMILLYRCLKKEESL